MGNVALWDTDGLAELYRQHAAPTIRIAYLMTGDRQLAEDLTQDAFIRAAGRLAHLRDRQAFGAYLRATVINLTKMHFRHRDVEDKHAPTIDPDRSLETAVAETDEVRKALRALSHRQRAAIVLRYYVDLPDDQIADHLGCSEGTVRSLLSRGTARLREVIGDDDDG